MFAQDNFKNEIKVSKVRAINSHGFGGAIFEALVENSDHKLAVPKKIVVYADQNTAPAGFTVETGLSLDAQGVLSQKDFKFKGKAYTENRLDASSLRIKLSGKDFLINYLSSGEFKGIGPARAKKIMTDLGEERALELLDAGDFERLYDVLKDSRVVSKLVEVWNEVGCSEVFQRLSDVFHENYMKIPPRNMSLFIRYYGKDAYSKLEENPYRFLAFYPRFDHIDLLARKKFGVSADDENRIEAVIEEALYQCVQRNKHTVCTVKNLAERFEGILGKGPEGKELARKVENSLLEGKVGELFLRHENNTYRPMALAIQEKFVAKHLSNLLSDKSRQFHNSFTGGFSDLQINKWIGEFEAQERERLNLKKFSLNKEQKLAVFTSIRNPFTLISGSAGTGKTTCLKCIYYCLNILGYTVRQVALAGRAAKRMEESTGVEAKTCASFILADDEEKVNKSDVLVIDESSMVDLNTMSRCLQRLADNNRVIMVGDTEQLPPVAAGLVFHCLFDHTSIPHVELLNVERQSEGTGIPQVSKNIRSGTLINLPNYSSSDKTGVFHIEMSGNHSDLEIMSIKIGELYLESTDNTLVICSAKKLAEKVNQICRDANPDKQREVVMNDIYRPDNPDLLKVGFSLNDRVICTKNLWDEGIQNGSLGIVKQIYIRPLKIKVDDGLEVTSLGVIQWDDGVCRPINEQTVHEIELGYAITVHKSQGSEFERVIIGCPNSKVLLDRSLVYTAVTRSKKQAVIVGEFEVIAEAVKANNKASDRNTALEFELLTIMKTD